DDAPGGPLAAEVVFRRSQHRPRVEGGDLVVVQVGGDETLGGVGVVQHPHHPRVDVQVVQPLQVVFGIHAHGAHGHGPPAQQLQVVGDVARTAAEFLAQAGHEERYAQRLDIVRQDVILEMAFEYRDGVE